MLILRIEIKLADVCVTIIFAAEAKNVIFCRLCVCCLQVSKVTSNGKYLLTLTRRYIPRVWKITAGINNSENTLNLNVTLTQMFISVASKTRATIEFKNQFSFIQAVRKITRGLKCFMVC